MLEDEERNKAMYIDKEAEKDKLNQEKGKAWQEEIYMYSKYEFYNAIQGNE